MKKKKKIDNRRRRRGEEGEREGLTSTKSRSTTSQVGGIKRKRNWGGGRVEGGMSGR